MTRFSARFAIPLALLLALAGIGVLYGRSVPRQDECPSHAALLAPQAFDPALEPLAEGPRATDLGHGRLTALWPARPERAVAVAMVRSYGLPNLLLQPAMALPGRNEPDDVRVGEIDTPAGRVPVHYAYERRGRGARLTAYLMAYRGEPVRSPVWTRIREGPRALTGGTWPITLFTAAVAGHVSELDARREDAEAWLRAAWSHYRAVCTR